LAWVMALVSFPVRAQKTAEVGKADALFNAGRSLLEAGEYADACPKFAESQKLAPGLGVTLYLADCYERLGRTASSLAEFRRAVQIASARGDKRGLIASQRAATLENRVPQLVIVVTPTAREQGVTVTRDGESVPSTQWDTPAAIDPGDHEIIVSAPSKVTRHLTAKLAAQKGVITTMVEGLDDPPVAPPESSLSSAATTASAKAPTTQKWIGVAVGVAGVVGLGVGAIFGVVTLSKLHQSNEDDCNSMDQCNAAGMGLRQDALHFGNASTAAFVAGGVALAGGVVLFLTAPKSGSPSAGLAIEPLLSPEVMGFCARSSF